RKHQDRAQYPQPDAWAMLQSQFGQRGARAGIAHRAAILRELRPLQQKICEAPRVCMLAGSAFIPGDGDAIALVRAREIMSDRSGEIVGSVESRDLSPIVVETLQAVGRLGEQEAAGTGHLEYPRLDLPAARQAPTLKMQSGIAKIQADHGFAHDARNIGRR